MPPSTPQPRAPSGAAPSPWSGAPLPDPGAVARAEKAPEAGPRIVFLSGGSALRGLSRALTRYTHNSVHLITPFDSGGSSALLRTAFGMLAVGDLRNRLLTLADEESRELRRVLHSRLPKEAPTEALERRLAALAAGRDPLLVGLPAPVRERVAQLFEAFRRRMPPGFDLRGASLGNLVLAASNLEHGGIGPALDELGRLLGARGRVLPTTDADLQLAARLADGRVLVGQHLLTGKEHPPLQSRIEEFWIVEGVGDSTRRADPPASPEAVREIARADLVCYPMGSFYTSLLCNILPRGIGGAVAACPAPKVYVPSTGRDPELVDTDIGRAAVLLVEALRQEIPGAPVSRLLDALLLDPAPDVYGAPPDRRALARLGIPCIDTRLVTPSSLPDVDADRLAQVLVSLARRERDIETETP